MERRITRIAHLVPLLCLTGICGQATAQTATGSQTNLPLRIMAANLNGNVQSYQPFALRILQGLRADVVALQEFNFSNNTPADFRALVDTTFGTNFSYYREPYPGSSDIPNGIVSRYPILAAGSWVDIVQSSPNRGFAWARIAVPGTNPLFVVSVHLLSGAGATARATEAANLKALIQATATNGEFVVVAGDFNTDSRTETALATFKTFLSDDPIPTDSELGGDPDTNEPRNKPYDYVLPNPALAARLTNAVFASHQFPNGLVFDSRVYSPMTDVPPIQAGDSGLAQHMAVLKDFAIPCPATNGSPAAPWIVTPPQSQCVAPGADVVFTAVATGATPLGYEWQFNRANLAGATGNSLSLTNVQPADAGLYSVVVTNALGSVTSAPAALTLTGAPMITRQPQDQVVGAGQDAIFTVTATGAPPLNYQWQFNSHDLPGATGASYTRPNAQSADAGAYTVVVTNILGSVTSTPAILTVASVSGDVIAQWNFNSRPPDGNSSTGSTTPVIGTGAASLVGGTTATFATGDSLLDPAGTTDNSAWNTSGYPAATAANQSAGVRFNVSTAGRQNLSLSWSEKASNTGSKYLRLQYSTNGSTFADWPAATLVSAAAFTAHTNSLAALPGVNNNPNFAFQFVAEFESTATGSGSAGYLAANPTSTYGTAGTVRFDMVTVTGSAIPVAPPPAATLSAAILAPGSEPEFLLTGKIGAAYVVETTTNLSGGVWRAVQTNLAPFRFVDTNAPGADQRYYRALGLP